MIRNLRVKGLIHRIDDDLEFNQDLNVFTGKNGSGKTMVLKLLWYLISGNLERIVPEIPFQEVSVETDSFSLSISKIESDHFRVVSKFPGEDESEETGTIEQLDDTLDELNRRIARTTKRSLFFPTFRRIEGGFSGVLRDADLSDRLITRGAEMLQISMERFSSEISTNEHKFVASISTNDINELLTQKYADIYEEISDLQSRLLDEISQRIQVSSGDAEKSGAARDVTGVLSDIQQVTDERDRLRRPFLVLSELTQSILQYQAIRVTGRSVRGEAKDGITLGEETDGTALGAAKEAIASDKLSAGEKQMLSFLCYNAFSEKTAIFIDEPELSLHVDWQRILVPTLLEQGTENQFFIATHSPFVYSKYPDKELLIGEDRGDN